MGRNPNKGGQGSKNGRTSQENFSSPWKNVLDILTIEHNLKIWAPLKKLFAPPGVPTWLHVWLPLLVFVCL